MSAWVTVVFNDKADNPTGLWGAGGHAFNIGTLKTNDPEKALRRVFRAFAQNGFFINHKAFDSATFKYALADGTPQQETFTRAALRERIAFS